MTGEDSYEGFQEVIAGRELSSPWVVDDHGRVVYVPDLALLANLLSIPVLEGRAQASGRLAKGIDVWCAHELRRAGFHADEVWPRARRPRVLPRDVALLLERLPRHLRAAVQHEVLRNKQVAPSEANVLGRVFLKQADVLIAQWSRGPELLISTKSMLSSYGKNLRNRFEESYGDAKNLRGRFPLLALGFLYLVRSTILDEPGSLEFAIDMLRKLREDVDVYDAAGLLIIEWDQPFDGIKTLDNLVPADLRVDQLLSRLISCVLERTPVQFHVRVRELKEQRPLPVAEAEVQPTERTTIEDEGLP